MAADDDDKTEEPSQKRLDDARKRGEVIYSAEVGAAFSLLAATAFVAFLAGPMAGDLGGALASLLENAALTTVDGPSLLQLSAGLGVKVGASMGMAVLIFWLGGVAARFVQDKPAFSAERLQPKLERINPFEGAKRVFGMQALANFGKAVLKVVIVGAAVAAALWPRDGVLSILPTLDLAALGPLIKERALSLLIACTLATTAIAALDFFYTRFEHMKRLRMSRQELKQEYKESEGDPLIKAKLRQLRSERSRQRMMTAVPSATVVITNPTHYAVALRYDAEKEPVPVCVAKGVNDIALKIREVAGEHDVPIIEDPPLARALYASAELEEPIPRAHFEAVAKVIGFVLKLAERKRRRR